MVYLLSYLCETMLDFDGLKCFLILATLTWVWWCLIYPLPSFRRGSAIPVLENPVLNISFKEKAGPSFCGRGGGKVWFRRVWSWIKPLSPGAPSNQFTTFCPVQIKTWRKEARDVGSPTPANSGRLGWWPTPLGIRMSWREALPGGSDFPGLECDVTVLTGCSTWNVARVLPESPEWAGRTQACRQRAVSWRGDGRNDVHWAELPVIREEAPEPDRVRILLSCETLDEGFNLCVPASCLYNEMMLVPPCRLRLVGAGYVCVCMGRRVEGGGVNWMS